jgi:ketosteroid isomerase-like protein
MPSTPVPPDAGRPAPAVPPPDERLIAEAWNVAQHWLPAFVAGHRAAPELYVDGVSTWHNVGEWEAPIKQTPSRTRRNEAGGDLHVEDVRLNVFTGGFVVQATTVGTAPDGTAVRLPTCLVVTVRDGRILRFEEYADSRQAEALFGAAGAKAEHDAG